MSRRSFLQQSLAVAGGLTIGSQWLGAEPAPLVESCVMPSPQWSVIPVVGDGKWIWNAPPKEGTGYLEPRSYSLSIGVEMEGIGNGQRIMATTPVPMAHPEQTIDEVKVETQGCEGAVRELAPGAGQLFMAAPGITKGQKISALVKYKLTLTKQFHNYRRDDFPEKQPEPPVDVRRSSLQDSPGIQTSSGEVRKLAAELIGQVTHPWDRATTFWHWVRKNIRPQIGSYTSVVAAIEKRLGDCEEMAGVFTALCRHVGIPARLVWVPNHIWAEFYLTDSDGKGHWIPAHTACYSWFGWTGAHELVIQKGDRVESPEQHTRVRLLEDWMQWQGRKPRARYVAELTPLPESEGKEAGPGARRKDENGEWKVVGTHPMDRYTRH